MTSELKNNIQYVGNFTKAMKDYTEEKIFKLNGNYTNARVKLTVLPNKKFNTEISLDNSLRASSTGDDFYSLVVDCVEKLTIQTEKYKKYLNKRNLKKSNEIESEDFDDLKISREKVLIVDSMSIYDAASRMEALDHTFFIFRDIDSDNSIAIIYRRNDNSLGYILCK